MELDATGVGERETLQALLRCVNPKVSPLIGTSE
jgi:hypothetical protein